MPHITKLHSTMPSQLPKAGRKREPAAASEHLLVDMKIAILVSPSIGLSVSDDASSCENDDCFDLPAFANRKKKKSSAKH